LSAGEEDRKREKFQFEESQKFGYARRGSAFFPVFLEFQATDETKKT